MDKELKEIFDELNKTAEEVRNFKNILKEKFKKECSFNSEIKVKGINKIDETQKNKFYKEEEGMNKRKFPILGYALLGAFTLTYAVSVQSQNLPPSQVSVKPQESRDINAAREHRLHRMITQEQRQEAATRAKAESPKLTKRLTEMRAKLIKARDTRVKELETLNNTITTTTNNTATVSSPANSNTAPLSKSKKGARGSK